MAADRRNLEDELRDVRCEFSAECGGHGAYAAPDADRVLRDVGDSDVVEVSRLKGRTKLQKELYSGLRNLGVGRARITSYQTGHAWTVGSRFTSTKHPVVTFARDADTGELYYLGSGVGGGSDGVERVDPTGETRERSRQFRARESVLSALDTVELRDYCGSAVKDATGCGECVSVLVRAMEAVAACGEGGDAACLQSVRRDLEHPLPRCISADEVRSVVSDVRQAVGYRLDSAVRGLVTEERRLEGARQEVGGVVFEADPDPAALRRAARARDRLAAAVADVGVVARRALDVLPSVRGAVAAAEREEAAVCGAQVRLRTLAPELRRMVAGDDLGGLGEAARGLGRDVRALGRHADSRVRNLPRKVREYVRRGGRTD